MLSAYKYIEQTLKNPVYSEILFQPAVVSGANLISEIRFDNIKVEFILISQIIFSVPGTLAAISFKDQLNFPLFTLTANTLMQGIFPFWKVVSGNYFQIIANANAGFNFSIGYQYIQKLQTEKK